MRLEATTQIIERFKDLYDLEEQDGELAEQSEEIKQKILNHLIG